MHRMMQSSGTAEGLRGLIDTSLLKSVKKVIQYRGLFGPNVFPLGQSTYTCRSVFQGDFICVNSYQHHVDVCPQRADIFGDHPRSGAARVLLQGYRIWH